MCAPYVCYKIQGLVRNGLGRKSQYKRQRLVGTLLRYREGSVLYERRRFSSLREFDYKEPTLRLGDVLILCGPGHRVVDTQNPIPFRLCFSYDHRYNEWDSTHYVMKKILGPKNKEDNFRYSPISETNECLVHFRICEVSVSVKYFWHKDI